MKKTIAFILAAALCLGLLVGCGQKEQTAENTPAPAPSQAPAPVEETPAPAPAPQWTSTIEGKNYLKGRSVVFMGAHFFGSEEGAELAEYMAVTEEMDKTIDFVTDGKIAGADFISYVDRSKNLPEGTGLLVVELTDNDLKRGECDLGRVSYSMDTRDYMTNSVLGALNFVFHQAWEKGIPAVLVTDPNASADGYEDLYRKGVELQQKWGFGYLDLRKTKDADLKVFTAEKINEYLIAIKGDAANAFQYAGNLPQYGVASVGADRTSILQGKHFIYLGSSVTLGSEAEETSFVDYIGKKDSVTFVKEAASGTSLCNYGPGSDRSYVNRLANIDPNEKADLFICQLSTNDVNKGAPLGEIVGSGKLEDFDLDTVAGGMEYITVYAQQTWGCPVMFYSGTDFGDDTYAQMVDMMYQLKDKYGIGVIDMYHNLSTNVEQYRQYMANGIHPTKRGYLEWWTPYMEDCIKNFLQGDKSEFDFTGFKTITTNDVIDRPMTFEQLPEGYNDFIPEHRGTKLVMHYTTDAYEDGKTYEKFCRVYLPYGYDANDKEKKYNVMYIQHGNGNTPNTLLDGSYNSDKETSANGMNLLNNLFDPDNGLMDNFIIICPTYYFNAPENSIMNPDSSGPAGDGRYDGDIKPYYYKEVVEDLIPQIESQFNVYCEDFSPEGIKASRDHRGWGGYSRGGACTWYMFHYDLEYFKWWMPMSAEARPNSVVVDDPNPEDQYQFLKEAIDAHPDLDFFIFAASGGPQDAPKLRNQMAYLVQQTDTFSFGLDTKKNNLYYTCSEFSHNMLYIPFYFYNARNVLFNNK